MNSLKGHLLVASPSLVTPFFSRTVILMLEHNDGGALGLVLNRPTEATVGDVSEQVLGDPFDWDKAIHLGGPVSGPLMVIHTDADLADQEVIPGLFTTADADKVRGLLRGRAEPSLVVANYSGWGAGQLEGEFAEDSWLSLPARADHVFWEGAADVWGAVIKQVRSADLSQILGIRDAPADPNLN